MEKRVLNKNVHFDGVTCALCGGSSFSEIPKPTTIWSCNGKNYKGEPCQGIICRCSKCEKIYMSDHFGKHGDVWECKTCNTVQWEFTDMMNALMRLREQSARARQLANEINEIRRTY